MAKGDAPARTGRAGQRGGVVAGRGTREEKGPRSMAQYDCPPERFCEVWTAASSVAEVSKKLNMPKPIVQSRASMYREKGIPLKRFQRVVTRNLDIDTLKAMVEKLNKQFGIVVPPETVGPRKKRVPGRVRPAAASSVVTAVLKQSSSRRRATPR
jgi:hypothetical protein